MATELGAKTTWQMWTAPLLDGSAPHTYDPPPLKGSPAYNEGWSTFLPDERLPGTVSGTMAAITEEI